MQKVTQLFKPKSYDDQKIKPIIALTMWALLLLGYILFIINWIMVLQLGGIRNSNGEYINGYILEFFGVKGANQTTNQAVSYTITLFRGLASLAIGWLMVKLSHKYAVLIALFLLAFALPAVFMPNFVLFIIARSFMALGGTMLIIFIQPVISRFFNSKQKQILSRITVQGYVVASMISFGIFLNTQVRDILLERWQIVAAVVGGLTLVPLIGYFIFGRNFDFNVKSEPSESTNLKPYTYKALIKEKQTIIWSLWYGFWLVVAVLTTTFVPTLLTAMNPKLSSYTIEGSIRIGWRAFYGFIFFVGGFLGFFLSLVNRFNIRRRPLLVTLMLFKTFFFVLIIIGALTEATWLTFVGSFLLAFGVFGSQGIYFTVPHEYEGNSPRRMTILFAYIWGCGYIIFTICNIIAALLLDYTSGWVSLTFILVIFIITIILTAMIKESKPNAKWLWKSINFKKQNKENKW